MNHNIYNNEEAVSEVIGFIYIFAIVILSMSIVFVIGYPMLQSSMDESIFESTQQSFIVLQSNMKMVGFDQVPVKSMKIQLNGAMLSVVQNSNLTIYADGETLEDVSGPIGEIEYQKNNKALTFENGGVWKKYPDGNIMVSIPRIYTGNEYGANFTSIGIVSVYGDSSTGGQGIAVLNMKHNESSIYKNSSQVNVTLKINSSYADAWRKYLEDIGFNIDNTYSTNSSLMAWRSDTMLVVGKHVVDVDIT
jgi:hypothetical protein